MVPGRTYQVAAVGASVSCPGLVSPVREGGTSPGGGAAAVDC